MNAPRYAVYMMLDEPKANASTHGYATAGWVAAPGGRAGDRADRRRCWACCPTSIDADAIQPGAVHPAGAGPARRRAARRRRSPPATPDGARPRRPAASRARPADPASGAPVPARPSPRDQRHEAASTRRCAVRGAAAALAELMRRPSRLAELMAAIARHRRHHRRQPRAWRPATVRRPAGRARRRPRVHRRCGGARRRRGAGAARHRVAARRAAASADRGSPSRAARLALIAAALAGPQPAHCRRGHRHQRQDQHRRVPAPALDARRACTRRASARSA